jgi:hypothetical protein
VLTVGASRIAAWQEEQRRCPVDDDTPHVPVSLDDAAAIFDVKLKTNEVRHQFTKPGCLILALASLGKS